MIAAVDINGLLAYKIYLGSIKAKVFGGFIIDLIKHLRDKNEDIKNKCLFFDNARIHTAEELDPLMN